MKLLIASNNAHKVREIKEILSDYFDELVTMREAGLDIDVVEDGLTFRENAVKKATEILEKSGFDATLADDSGLCVDALNGAPGVYSARYAGEGHDDKANNAKLMQAMKDVPDEKRTCRFVSAVALARRGRPVLVVEGKAEGLLLRAPAGENGFGY
ncbi:MAG: non-canonical purine NTP pyrophosphatase, partial [Clostridia bacterium]|nr:non-canonical purine NTP pyrophosphatase [Clostridia bacterium]